MKKERFKYMYISIYVNVCCGIGFEMWKEGSLMVFCELRVRDYLISTFTSGHEELFGIIQ